VFDEHKILFISLDYDDTFTADPDLWKSFIGLCLRKGHQVVIITARKYSDESQREITEALRPYNLIIYHTDCMPKIEYAKRAYLDIDIWIDDSPRIVVNGC
jgi:hypothetical protein